MKLVPTEYGIDTQDPRLENIRIQPRGYGNWAIVSLYTRDVLNRECDWEWESLPSGRTDDFIERTRYATLEEAEEMLERYIATLHRDERTAH